MWMTVEPTGSLSTDEKIQVLKSFAELNPEGEIVLTGGETMIKPDEFFALTETARNVGLKCACNSNGSYLTEDLCRTVLSEGPNYFVVSLDSHHCFVHDYVRGIQGAFVKTIKSLSMLIELKKTEFPSSATQIFTNTVLFSANICSIIDYVEFVEQLGVEGVIFQMLGPTFWNKKDSDPFFDKNYFSNRHLAKLALRDMASKLDQYPIIRTTKQDFKWMEQYIDNPNSTEDQVCDSQLRNIIVDVNGDVRLCFNMLDATGQASLANVRHSTLSEIWYSEEASSARLSMEQCRRGCGMLNCHRMKSV